MAVMSSWHTTWFRQLLKTKLIWLTGLYAVLNLLMLVLKSNAGDAELLALVYNTRFLLFLVYGWLLANLFDAKILKAQALKIVFLSSVAVGLFGLVQFTLLPEDALTHFGYSRANGVLPAFFIDNKPGFERVMSSLRDPNSLGSYLIIIIALASAFYIKNRDNIKKKFYLGVAILSGWCLFLTFSRSAWLGAIVTLAALAFLVAKHINLKKILIPSTVVLIVVLSGLVALRNNYAIKNIVFHADESTVLEDPNELRARFFKESLQSVMQQPLGHGLGTAGLVSIRNTQQGTVLTENYYLQVAYETGLLGLLLFMAILWLVAKRLYELAPQSFLAVALLASLAGLMVTNFLVHIWSNEAVAYTWWGLVGLLLEGPGKKLAANKNRA